MIMATIVGGSLLSLSTNSDDAVHTFPGEVEQLVKTSLEKAKKLKQTQYLHASKDSMWLSSIADEMKPSSENSLQIELPENSTFSYKPASAKQWIKVQNNQDILHIAFSTSGLSEYISIRITFDNSYAECSFHPLTGTLIQP